MTDQTDRQRAEAKARQKVRLVNCPIGLFVSDAGELCLKTEYGNNEGRIDAYIVSSGEFFWGAPPQTIESQRAQLVTPYDHTDALLSARREGWVAGIEAAARAVRARADQRMIDRDIACEDGKGSGFMLAARYVELNETEAAIRALQPKDS